MNNAPALRVADIGVAMGRRVPRWRSRQPIWSSPTTTSPPWSPPSEEGPTGVRQHSPLRPVRIVRRDRRDPRHAGRAIPRPRGDAAAAADPLGKPPHPWRARGGPRGRAGRAGCPVASPGKWLGSPWCWPRPASPPGLGPSQWRAVAVGRVRHPGPRPALDGTGGSGRRPQPFPPRGRRRRRGPCPGRALPAPAPGTAAHLPPYPPRARRRPPRLVRGAAYVRIERRLRDQRPSERGR